MTQTNELLFTISNHGTNYEGETFYNERVVKATDADALIEWATKVCYAGWNPQNQAVTIARLSPCVIEANDMKLEGSSKWMVGRSSFESVCWSTEHDWKEQAMGRDHLRSMINHYNEEA